MQYSYYLLKLYGQNMLNIQVTLDLNIINFEYNINKEKFLRDATAVT